MKDLDSQLQGVQTAAIAGHVRPDGDCVGSCLATYNYIKDNYPQIQVDLYLEPIPNIFKFLKRSKEIIHECTEHEPYDLFIAQDCGDTGRLGEAAQYFTAAKKTICIDHHISNQSFADENYIFPHASSASELVFELLDEKKISREIAECIYVGIIHDTGVFQYSSTSAKTMNVAGRLMNMGIDFTEIVDKTFYTKTYQQNRIMGQALVQSRLELGGAVITSVVTKEQMEELQYSTSMTKCHGCTNNCRLTINKFSDGRRYISGNRCERGLGKEKKKNPHNKRIFLEKVHFAGAKSSRPAGNVKQRLMNRSEWFKYGA